MPLGLVIENIAGSVRQLAPAAANAGPVADKTGLAPLPSPASASVSAAPLSGQGEVSAGFSVVVLQLLNAQGAVVSTIPTAQQLAAYRNGTATPPA